MFFSDRALGVMELPVGNEKEIVISAGLRAIAVPALVSESDTRMSAVNLSCPVIHFLSSFGN